MSFHSGSKRSSTRHKKITIRKSTRSKDFSTINHTPDDDLIRVDTHQRKRQSIDISSNDSIIPLATDLQSLPGHTQDEFRDKRFLNYSDINTLAMHLNTCLYIDKKSFSSSYLTKQHIFKTRHNVLTKIFKLSYRKTFQKHMILDPKSVFNKKDELKPTPTSSSTSISFQTDWSVNRRSSSSHRHDPKNVFHVLQLNPKKQLFSSNKNTSTTKLLDENQQTISYEHIKNLLVRTYYPHFHAAVESGYYFGSKLKLLTKRHELPVVIKPESPIDIDETMTITLKSPPSNIHHESRRRGRKAKHKPLPITSTERRVSEEIPPVMFQESPTIVLPSLLTEKQTNTNNRKRKTSITINSNINERKKKRFIPSPSPEFSSEYQDVSYSDR